MGVPYSSQHAELDRISRVAEAVNQGKTEAEIISIFGLKIR